MFKNFLQRLIRTEGCHFIGGETPLTEAPVGKKIRVVSLSGDESEANRLREMGLRESNIIEKMADSGALICRVGDAKVVLSKRLAENIIVKEVSPTGKDSVLLSAMSVGSRGVVESFVAESDDYERIEEMGLTPGEEVEVVRYAPLGDPIEIKIRGYCLSLRKEEADRIRVAVSQ